MKENFWTLFSGFLRNPSVAEKTMHSPIDSSLSDSSYIDITSSRENRGKSIFVYADQPRRDTSDDHDESAEKITIFVLDPGPNNRT